MSEVEKQQIAQILNLSSNDHNNDSWEIADSKDDLRLIHFTRDAKDLSKIGHLKGVIVSLDYNMVIATCFPDTPVAKLDQIPLPGNNYNFADSTGKNYVFPAAQTRFQIGMEGAIYRVFKYKGQIYGSINRRIDASRSRFSDSPSFKQIFETMANNATNWNDGNSDINNSNNDTADNKPKFPDILFGKDDPEGPATSSPYCHYWLLCHPSLLIASHINMSFGNSSTSSSEASSSAPRSPEGEAPGKGIIVYLGYDKVWDPEDPDLPLGADEIDTTLYQVQGSSDLNTPQPFIYIPQDISREEANQHLMRGFVGQGTVETLPERLRPGEFVIAKMGEENEEKGSCSRVKTIRIHSPAYQWRTDVIGGSPNLYYRFVRLSSDANFKFNKDSSRATYLNKYPLLKYIRKDQIWSHLAQNGPYLYWPALESSLYSSNNNSSNSKNIAPEMRIYYDARNGYCRKSVAAKLYNIWCCMMMAVPLHRQVEVYPFLDQFLADRAAMINWLQQYQSRKLAVNGLQYSIIRKNKRLWEILTTASSDGGSEKEASSKIYKTILEEKGKSLYRLIKTHHIYLATLNMNEVEVDTNEVDVSED